MKHLHLTYARDEGPVTFAAIRAEGGGLEEGEAQPTILDS